MKLVTVSSILLVVISTTSNISASPAFANCELSFGYCVKGVPLLAGETRDITASAGSALRFRMEFLSIKSEIVCHKLKLAATAKPVIAGGMPGTSENQLAVFEQCTSTLAGGTCTTTEVSPFNMRSSQVKVLAPATLKGRPATLISPASEGIFSIISQHGCTNFPFEATFTLTGNIAALNEPLLVEQELGSLVFSANASQGITETLGYTGRISKDGLQAGGNPMTLEGTVLLALTSKGAWGVF